MGPLKTARPTPHAAEREEGARQDGEAMPPQALDRRPGVGLEAKHAESIAAKPQSALRDQVTHMESAGDAQPQAGDVTHEERERQGVPVEKP
jgi:hypothetical protein